MNDHRGLSSVAELTGRRAVCFSLILLLLLPLVHSDEEGIADIFIPGKIVKSMETFQVFMYDILAFISDLFAILLFIAWMLVIALIGYVIVWFVNLPKKVGANSIQDAVIQLAVKLWNFIK